ncbi:MAG TPA: phosphonate ABC transporter ATP-binding protein [Mycobacteriales bacterium]|jgi:phosphonate transport system ATP-binding protein|nr:phosphonate ABC transporter ATP-binding protein [Mycobacteriales bacterium]
MSVENSGHTAVRVAGVTKIFGTTVALRDVSFAIPRGQMVGLLGLSGSGKSTLLRVLNGLHRPASGAVEVLGCDVVAARRSALRDIRRRIGFVFQQFELVGRLSVVENVLSGALGRLRGPRFGVVTYSSALRREALAHLDRVGLGDRAFQRSSTLSGGQQQRVAIARALMQRPALVLADEPVASLDPETAGQVMDLLFRICREDRLTVIASLHQVELALQWTQRLIGLRDGEIVLDTDARTATQETVMEIYRRVLVGQDPHQLDASQGADHGGAAAVGRPRLANSVVVP